MNKSELLLLAGTLGACAESPKIEKVTLPITPITTTQETVKKEVLEVSSTDANSDAVEVDTNIATDEQLQAFLHESRQLIRDTKEDGEVAQNSFEKKFNELVKLQKLVDLQSFGGDSSFTSFFSGKVFSLSLSYGEGSYMSLKVGDENAYFDISDPSDISIIDNHNYFPVSDKIHGKKANELIDFIISGLKETIAAQPIYRAIKTDNPDVNKNFGLNLRDEDGDIQDLMPPETIVQTLGIADSKGSIFVYCMIDGQIRAGWVKEGYLDKEILSTFEQKKSPETQSLTRKMYVTEASDSNGGLNFRAMPSTNGRLLGKVPVGTEVTAIEMMGSNSDKWAKIKYIDKTTGEEKTGWVCFYMVDKRFLEDL